MFFSVLNTPGKVVKSEAKSGTDLDKPLWILSISSEVRMDETGYVVFGVRLETPCANGRALDAWTFLL